MRPERRFLVGGNWKLNGDRALVKKMITEILADLPGEPSTRRVGRTGC